MGHDRFYRQPGRRSRSPLDPLSLWLLSVAVRGHSGVSAWGRVQGNWHDASAAGEGRGATGGGSKPESGGTVVLAMAVGGGVV